MQIEITYGEIFYNKIVRAEGGHWLGENKDKNTVYWWNDVVDHKDWFVNILTPTPEELVLFELEFGKEVLDFVFSSNKKLKIQSVEDFK